MKIVSRWDSEKVLFEGDADSMRALLVSAVKSGANLSRADLSRADLSGANLYGADLYGYFCFGPGGSRNSYTWARWEPEGYMVHCGCKTLELKEFAKVVKATHKNNYHAEWYAANIAVMKLVAANSKEAYEARDKSKEVEPERIAAALEAK